MVRLNILDLLWVRNRIAANGRLQARAQSSAVLLASTRNSTRAGRFFSDPASSESGETHTQTL